MSASKILLYLCAFFAIGIALASFVKTSQILVLGYLIFSVLMVIIFAFLDKKALIVAGFSLLFLAAGIARFQNVEFKIETDPIRKYNDRPEKIILTGQIIDGPDIRDRSQKLKVKIDGTESIVLVTVGRYPEYNYLDRIKISGGIKTPAVTDDFNYKIYLLKDGVYSVMDFPKVEVISRERRYTLFNFLYDKILFLKEKLRQSIYANFNPPQKFILEGVLLGNNKTMPQDLRDKLNGTGLRYLTAISGVHVLLLSDMMVSLLLALGLWRAQALTGSLGFVWIYVILTGLPASGIRAAVMGSIFLLAQALGRQNASSRTIVLAAALMLAQNPMLLRYDAGFQLSFLASMGIIYFKPVITNWLEPLIKRRLDRIDQSWRVGKLRAGEILRERAKYILDILSVTITAQLFTIPIMIYNFGALSLIAPLANLLAVPVVYWLMMFGFLASFFGIFFNFLGWVFALPTWLLSSYFLKVMDIFYQPWAVAEIPELSWIWLAAYYVLLALAVWFFNKRRKLNFLEY